MDERERQYREYLALRQHEQQEEISREYEKEQERLREGSLRNSGDDKYGQFMPGERSHVPNVKPYVPDEREQTRRISNKAKRVSAAENPSYSADGIRSRREREARVLQMISFLSPVLEHVPEERREEVAARIEQTVRSL